MIFNSISDELEEEVLLNFAKIYKDYGELLLRQYKNIKKREKNFSNCGFFINYTVDIDKCESIPEDFVLGQIFGKLNNESVNVGFLLFIRNGYISMLECFECGAVDIRFPEIINDYYIYKMDLDKDGGYYNPVRLS